MLRIMEADIPSHSNTITRCFLDTNFIVKTFSQNEERNTSVEAALSRKRRKLDNDEIVKVNKRYKYDEFRTRA